MKRAPGFVAMEHCSKHEFGGCFESTFEVIYVFECVLHSNFTVFNDVHTTRNIEAVLHKACLTSQNAMFLGDV